MKPTAHIATSAAIATTLYILTKSVSLAGISFFCGFLIDADHLLDYVREYGFRGSREEFFRLFYETRFNKLLLVFHAWEWVVALLLLAAYNDWNNVVLGGAIGIFQHLVFDQMTNGVTPGGYFIGYRAAKHFSRECIVREEVVQRKRSTNPAC